MREATFITHQQPALSIEVTLRGHGELTIYEGKHFMYLYISKPPVRCALQVEDVLTFLYNIGWLARSLLWVSLVPHMKTTSQSQHILY